MPEQQQKNDSCTFCIVAWGVTIIVVMVLIMAGLSSPVEAQSREPVRNVLVVLDDTASASLEEAGEDVYKRTRAAFVKDLGTRFGRDDQVTIMSLARPRVIWAAPADWLRTGKKTSNLTRFLNRSLGGCASFDAVLADMRRAEAKTKAPITDLLIFSSMIEVGDDCVFDEDQPHPSDQFYTALIDWHLEQDVHIELWAVDTLVAGETFDKLNAAGVNFDIYGVDETLMELGG